MAYLSVIAGHPTGSLFQENELRDQTSLDWAANQNAGCSRRLDTNTGSGSQLPHYTRQKQACRYPRITLLKRTKKSPSKARLIMRTNTADAPGPADLSDRRDVTATSVNIWVAVITAGGVLGAALIAASYGNEKLDSALASVKALSALVQEQGIQLSNAKADTALLQRGSIGLAAVDGQKLCRVLVADKWSDGMIVPKDWSKDMCNDYRLKTKGAKIQLGCIKTDEITLGGEDGTKPSPNCGW